MKIAIFPNFMKAHPKKIAKELCEFLKEKNVEVFIEDSFASEMNALPFSSIDLKIVDFSISLGGDGTILRLVHRFPELDAPIFGINLGSLGFMADTPIHDMYNGIESLLNGKFTIDERIMMQGKSSKGDTYLAVNEIVVHRAQNPCLIDLAIYVDDIYLNTFSADGIIICTPTGSTAYSLSAGGPILTPDLHAFVMTPICPHTISNRPIVFMPKETIRIEYISRHNPVEITYDGFTSSSLTTNEELVITPSSRKFRLVSLLQHDYFSTLRTKLAWSGKLKV